MLAGASCRDAPDRPPEAALAKAWKTHRQQWTKAQSDSLRAIPDGPGVFDGVYVARHLWPAFMVGATCRKSEPGTPVAVTGDIPSEWLEAIRRAESVDSGAGEEWWVASVVRGTLAKGPSGLDGVLPGRLQVSRVDEARPCHPRRVPGR